MIESIVVLIDYGCCAIIVANKIAHLQASLRLQHSLAIHHCDQTGSFVIIIAIESIVRDHQVTKLAPSSNSH
jgi:hypothetical protein